ncbi:HNH endonuclease [Rhizobium oryzihabitans]|uniref:HNH endonuclease n=1 Tax=Rhizobium oryzihabitans TaxID=2267833 RepID=A0A7L5BK89_9HYPH|nr:HNH endonuclease [Rhizobium oryzihabitans]QIB36837.1 HNH endonuclease [Rhizobium oryzihabitans]QIB39301.1 HNH endonuclease [Rhizobium oryzihabitans]
MARTVEEWIGKSDDHRAPGSVRDRIMSRDKRICHLCQSEIQVGQKWDLDHVTALINGGENRESNLKPAHRKCHVEKTALDVAEKAKVAAVRKKHLGITRPKQTIQSPGFQKSAKPKKAVVYRPVTFYREDTP